MFNYTYSFEMFSFLFFICFLAVGIYYNFIRPSILRGPLKKHLQKNLAFFEEVPMRQFYKDEDSARAYPEDPSDKSRELVFRTGYELDILEIVHQCQNFFIGRKFEVAESVQDDDAYRFSTFKDDEFYHFQIRKGQDPTTILIAHIIPR